jgi:hypothetical protein
MISHLTSVKPISSEEFDLWQPALKVIVHDHARRFARVSLDLCPHEFAISWRSDSIEPVVHRCNKSELWLGVDQRAVCIAHDGTIVASIGLSSFLVDIACLKACVAVLAETDVVLFNTDHSIRKIHGLRDNANSISEIDGKIFVKFEDGRLEIVE